MPTSKQRRDAAHRKLERQLQRRQELAAQRRRQTIIMSVIGAIVVVALGVWIVVANTEHDDATAATAKCTYVADSTSQGGPGVPTDTTPSNTGKIKLKVATTQGNMVFTLDRSLAPCAVNSWDHLVTAGFFSNSPCHRLTTSTLKVLQCGDPTGTGTGGPGYTFDEEKPTKSDPYPKGAIAMANSGSQGTTGSQFFICYESCSDALSNDYSLVGSVTSGLDVVQKVADAGSDNSNGTGDGKPNLPITITSITKAS